MMVPWLIGEARYVSLEAEPMASATESYALPTVAHARQRSEPVLARVSPTVRKYLPKNMTTSSLLFCISVEESLTLLGLVVLERLHADHAWLRVHWSFSMTIIISLIVLLLPLYACTLLCFGHVNRRWSISRALASAVLFILWCWLFVRVPLPSTVTPATAGYTGSLIARTAMIGIWLIAILSGSISAGAMCDSYEMFLRKKRRWSESDVTATRDSFQRTCADLTSRRTAAAELQAELEASGPRSSWRFWGRSAKDRELAMLQTEIAGLAAMASALRSDLEYQERQERRVRQTRTVVGYAMLLGGYAFSMYCALRLVQCVLNLVFLGYNATSSRDWVAMSTAQVMNMLGFSMDVAVWSPRINFLLVGGLIVMRLHVILGTLSAMIQSVATGISTQLLVLFTSQILCIYGLAALVQMHSGVTTATSGSAPSALLATLPEFQRVFGRAFDAAFILSAIATGAYRWFVWHSDASMGAGW
ncbi:hypothetical protein Malapachy_2405 [Malassezia pachydermatis]|uniref:G protein-coupled receptor 89 n=1 Tax=Malassezia pachydermatis TaxID=77020 RepID=A0A0M8MPB8_9BASI|nr:hypothetical protein Malapachy_2405 [Malassezia pachydermatis]KOS15618.1 hypothetical protein Malapachy_2405 [Malassezia pachydermatis]